jgi:replicative DNA helicase
MNYDRIRDEVLPRWEEILNQITSPAKKAGEYVCPLCGHGKGGDGLKLNPRSSKYSLKCFGSCGFSGDIIELLGRVEGLDSYPERIERASFLLGIDTEERTLSSKVGQNQPKSERSTHTDMSIHTDTYTHTDTTDYSQYFRECHSRLDKTDYLTKRGISKATADSLGLGYDPMCKPYGEKTTTLWKALIIPVSKTCYVIRDTDPTAKDKRYSNAYGGAQLYHTRALREATSPIFLTEGELDSISIMEVGGEAVALGGVGNWEKFINCVKTQKPVQPLVLALDNDPAGREASDKLASGLEALGIEYIVYNPFGGYKDANEALTAEREALKLEVLGIAQKVEEKRAEAMKAELEEYQKTTVSNYLQSFIDGIAESANTPATPTGFSNLDEVLDGGLYEGLYCVGAITSLGKTTFLLQVADQIAQSGKDVFIFSLEMATSELISKSLSRLTLLETLDRGADTSNAKTNRGITTGSRWKYYSEEEKSIINSAVQTYEGIAQHIRIFEGVGDYGVEEIRGALAKHKRLTGEAPVVIVDYLQILAPSEDDKRSSDKQITDKAVLELKRMSRDFKTPIIGISSFNRDNYTAPVNLSSFKESGAIEYSSDVLIGLQFEGMDYVKGENEKDRNSRIRELRETMEAKGRDGLAQRIEVKILKNRNGYKGKTLLDFFPRFNYFKSVEG